MYNISVLFTEINSVYKYLGCNTYDLYNPHSNCQDFKPCIYHPPCREWSRLRKFANFHPGEKWLGIWSVIRARKYGGIVEHPEGSMLFKTMGCPLPGNHADSFGGIMLHVNQVNFGHICEKSTWLYVVGFPIGFEFVQSHPFVKSKFMLGSTFGKSGKKTPGKQYRNYTPLPMALELIRLCSLLKKL